MSYSSCETNSLCQGGLLRGAHESQGGVNFIGPSILSDGQPANPSQAPLLGVLYEVSKVGRGLRNEAHL